MTESLHTMLTPRHSNEQTAPPSHAEFDLNSFPYKNQSMKSLPMMPCTTMRLPLMFPDGGKHPVSEASLISLMASRRSTLKSMHKKFSLELQSGRPQVMFDSTISPVSHEDSSTTQFSASEPPPKRRRFQRRNSKTPAMMLSSLSSVVVSEFSNLDDCSTQSECHTKESTAPVNQNAWDSGLEIAEDLFRHLKGRKQSLGKHSAP
jgi:hypothetical protein